jgi:hypothetical protein
LINLIVIIFKILFTIRTKIDKIYILAFHAALFF